MLEKHYFNTLAKHLAPNQAPLSGTRLKAVSDRFTAAFSGEFRLHDQRQA
jgi:hypothetical protein